MCLQFLLREGRLHLVVFMRANDAYRGMVSDVFSFTFLQEVMARQLGAELGDYHHLVGSMHLYKVDFARASAVLADAERIRGHRYEFPAMPPGDNWPYIRRVLEAECALREDREGFELAEWKADLPEYWYQVVLLLALFRKAIRNQVPGADVLGQLLPIYRDLVKNRWPTLVA
jgi:thymidylate synthase